MHSIVENLQTGKATKKKKRIFAEKNTDEQSVRETIC